MELICGRGKLGTYLLYASRPREHGDVPVRESCEVRVMCFFIDEPDSNPALRKLYHAGAGTVAPDVVTKWEAEGGGIPASSKL